MDMPYHFGILETSGFRNGQGEKIPGVPSEKIRQTAEMLAIKAQNFVAFLNLRCAYSIIRESDTSTRFLASF